MKKEGDEKSCCYSFISELLNDSLSSLCFVGLSLDYDVRGKTSLLKPDGKLYNQRKSFLEKLKKILEDVENSKLDYYTKQYYLKYNSLPFYILVGNLAFGDLCILFGMLKIEYREKFVAAFKGKEIHTSDIFSFCTILSYLTLVRNKVHHHEPIIPVFSDVLHNETIGSRIMAIKNLLRFYNESKYFHLDISNIKPSLKIKIKGRNTEYCKNLERFYSLF